MEDPLFVHFYLLTSLVGININQLDLKGILYNRMNLIL